MPKATYHIGLGCHGGSRGGSRGGIEGELKQANTAPCTETVMLRGLIMLSPADLLLLNGHLGLGVAARALTRGHRTLNCRIPTASSLVTSYH